MKVRTGGAWVDTGQAGTVWVDGQAVPFGAPPGPVYESLTWPNPVPNLTDAVDPGYTYNMGIRFHLLAARPCHGIRWRAPDTAPGPLGGPHVAAVWNPTGESRIAFKDFTAVPGDYQDILFDDPVDLAAAPQEYIASVFTAHYVHRAPTPPSGWLVESPSANVRGNMGKLSSTSTATGFPAANFESWYYVSPLVAVP